MAAKRTDTSTETLKSPERLIVAIGASAGGLEAIHEFFDHMPAQSGLTFVVIQHLSPDYKSLLVELVSKHTHMQVYEATDDVVLKPDCVYIIPNKKLMTMKGFKLKLADKEKDRMPNTSIDTFLFTLAKEQKDKAIAIILSGTGTDGTKGIRAIKEHGGMVIAQDPVTAKFDGMPNSAITSGNTDLVLTPDKMPEEIFNYISHPEPPIADERIFDEKTLNELFQMVSDASGKDFTLYKTPTILRRISRRLATLEIPSLEDYLKILRKDSKELQFLSKDFLIGVTKFFRDKSAFRVLEDEVIPDIISRKKDGESIKVWVCACSTGEEAYSIAVLFAHCIEQSGKKIDLKLFATDLDEASIEIAAKNSYPPNIASDIPTHLLKRYFVKEGQNYAIVPQVRKQIVFARHDVIKSPPFIKNDLVSCRNMLIYMNNLLQQKILATFHYSLSNDSYLFLGPAENAAVIKEGIREISSKWKIYKKAGNINYGLHHTYSRDISLKRNQLHTGDNAASPAETLASEFNEFVTEEFKTVGVFIDRTLAVKETIGDFNLYLSLPKKKLNLNVLNMLGRETAALLNNALRKVWKERKKVTLQSIKIIKDDQELTLKITIKPPVSDSADALTLLLFSQADADRHTPQDENYPVMSHHDPDYLLEIESELTETRVNLQTAMEEMETTNEELQSSNEELLSANEELQSSNEELQSLNEELHTLNTEHQLKIRELVELNDDLDNYFRSTNIGQIFVDSNLLIRKFNPAAIDMVNLINSDVGRPINHISSNIMHDNLVSDIHHVLYDNQVVEKEVRLKSGAYNLMRIMPYIRKDKKRDGVVISFIDITTVSELNNIVSGVFNASSSGIMAFQEVKGSNGRTVDFKCTAYNDQALAVLQKPKDTVLTETSIKDIPELIETFDITQYIRSFKDDTPLHTEIHTSDNRWYQLTSAAMMNGFVLSLTDISRHKAAEQKLRKNYNELISAREDLRSLNHQLEDKIQERTRKLTESEERFKLVSQATNDTIWDWNLATNEIWRSENFTTMFGYSRDEATNNVNFWFDKIHPDDRNLVRDGVYDAINNHELTWSAEYRFLKADNTYAVLLDRGSILEDEFKTPYRIVGSIIDITRLVETERRLNATESRFRKVFESNMIGMLFANMDGEIIEANDAFLKMLGYSREDLQGKLNWKDITPKKYMDVSFAAAKQLREEGVCPPFEKQYLKKNGEPVSILMGSALLENDDDIFSVSYIIDISRQKAEESRRRELQKLLKNKQEEFSNIFSNAPALITIKRGPQLKYEFVNKAYQAFDGGTAYIGRPTLEVHPEDVNSPLYAIEREVMETGEARSANEFLVERIDPSTKQLTQTWFDFIYTPVYDHNNKVDGIAFFGFDVTDLVQGRKATEELMLKKDEFMSIASHELKTPITTLKGSLQILDRIMGKENVSPMASSFIEKASSQTEKLTALVDDLLDVTRLQEGKMALNYASFDANSMVAECVEDFRAQDLSHRLILTCEGQLIVNADRARLEQVLHNFLTNAIKYSPGADKVLIHCEDVAGNFKVTVTDFGIGIAADKRDQLFDRFFRVPEASSHFAGLGLGLYICAEIIKRHNGEIGVNSVPGEGSTFWFTIPLEGAEGGKQKV